MTSPFRVMNQVNVKLQLLKTVDWVLMGNTAIYSYFIQLL